MFNHIIVTTCLGCNLRCPFCYESHDAVNMTSDVYESIKRFLVIQKKSGLSERQGKLSQKKLRFRLEYFGGEPLLCLDKVLELSAFANALFSDADSQYLGSMTTNAVLLDFAAFKKLNTAGVRSFHITLGPKAVHDTQRIFADGRGTFDIIWNNLIQAKKSDLPFEIVLRIHYTPDSLESVVDFTKDELSIFLDDERFKYYFAPIAPLGGKRDHELNMFNTYPEAQKALEQFQTRGSYKTPSMCYASNPHSLVILPDGAVAKCTVSFDEIGRLRPDGLLEIDNKKFSDYCWPYLHPEQKIVCSKKRLEELYKTTDKQESKSAYVVNCN